MIKLLDGYHWVLQHPGESMLWLLIIGAGSFAVAAVAYFVTAAREERREEAERQRFERILRASTPPREWPRSPDRKSVV